MNEELMCAACGRMPTRGLRALCDSCQEAEDRHKEEADFRRRQAELEEESRRDEYADESDRDYR